MNKHTHLIKLFLLKILIGYSANILAGPPGYVTPDGYWIDGNQSTHLGQVDPLDPDFRGYSPDKIDSTIRNPARVEPGFTKQGQPVHNYFNADGSYVVVQDSNKKIVQISDTNKARWLGPKRGQLRVIQPDASGKLCGCGTKTLGKKIAGKVLVFVGVAMDLYDIAVAADEIAGMSREIAIGQRSDRIYMKNAMKLHMSNFEKCQAEWEAREAEKKYTELLEKINKGEYSPEMIWPWSDLEIPQTTLGGEEEITQPLLPYIPEPTPPTPFIPDV